MEDGSLPRTDPIPGISLTFLTIVSFLTGLFRWLVSTSEYNLMQIIIKNPDLVDSNMLGYRYVFIEGSL